MPFSGYRHHPGNARQQGGLRFILNADGAAWSPASPCASNARTPITVIYRLYDNRNRVTETGYLCVAAWDDLTGHVNDQTWPQHAANWRFRTTCDGNGTLPYAIGRPSKMETNNGATIVTVTFAYDIRGDMTTNTIDDGVNVVALMLPRANTSAMQMHLDEISRNVAAKAHAVVLMDRAGWHKTDKLKLPNNLTIILLPSRSPELNPVENIWQYL